MKKQRAESKPDFNPWIAILTKPRETIKAIVEYNPNYHLLLLSMIYGFSAVLGIAQNFKLGEKLDFISIIIPAIIIAPLWGYLVFSISSWFVFFTGKWIGGKGRYKHIRAAIAWSNVPSIISGLLWVILLLAFGASLFQDFANKEQLSSVQLWGVFSVVFVQIIASVWSIVIYINALAEVQKFSILRSIFNLILSALVVVAITIVIAYLAKWICAPFFDNPILVSLP